MEQESVKEASRCGGENGSQDKACERGGDVTICFVFYSNTDLQNSS